MLVERTKKKAIDLNEVQYSLPDKRERQGASEMEK